jgi:hypothetical protein
MVKDYFCPKDSRRRPGGKLGGDVSCWYQEDEFFLSRVNEGSGGSGFDNREWLN